MLLRLAGVPRDALTPAVEAQAALLDSRGWWLEELLERLQAASVIAAVAPAARLSSALQSALMLREGPRISAHAAETGDWSHVDVYLSKYPGYLAILAIATLLGWPTLGLGLVAIYAALTLVVAVEWLRRVT